MAKVLVADDDRDVRTLLTDILANLGHEVTLARNGVEALEMAAHEAPDIILIDLVMPELNGFEVIKLLREGQDTEAIPVIALTAIPAALGESVAMDLGVAHYISKPFERRTVENAVKVTLWEKGASHQPLEGHPTLLRTTRGAIDQVLGGGIPLAALTLVEGDPSTGKSVLCQHLAYGALSDGHRVAYFSSRTAEYLPDQFASPEHGVSRYEDLNAQFASIGHDVSRYITEGYLDLYPGWGVALDDPEEAHRSASGLNSAMDALRGEVGVIIVDDITDLLSYGREASALGFFARCRQLSNNGPGVILVARSYAFGETMLMRLVSACDVCITLRTESIGAKMVKTLEARKLYNAPMDNRRSISFDVVHGVGMKPAPGVRMRI